MSAVPNPQPQMNPPPARSALWHNRDFLLLWSGQAVSSVGTQVSQLAFPLLVLAVTHSPAQAGIVAAMRGIPYVFLTLPTGVLVDRWDRKRIMVWSDIGRSIALATVPVALFLGHLSLLQLALVSLIEGTLFTFFNVAESACIPQVVPREQLGDALAQNSVIDSVSIMVGPALAGILYGLSHAVPFLADAVSYAVSVVCLRQIRTEFQEERESAPLQLRAEIATGLRWLWGHAQIRFLALLMGGLNLFSMGYPIILIVRAQQLHASSFAIGLMFATGGIGSIAGALVTGPLLRRFTVGQVMIAGTWIWVLTWPPYAVAPNLLLLGVANVVGWVIVPIVMTTQFSYRLSVIPDELQGRVNSVFKLVAFGANPLSLALTGALVQGFGAVDTIWLITAPQVLLAAITALYRPLRAAPKLAHAR